MYVSNTSGYTRIHTYYQIRLQTAPERKLQDILWRIFRCDSALDPEARFYWRQNYLKYTNPTSTSFLSINPNITSLLKCQANYGKTNVSMLRSNHTPVIVMHVIGNFFVHHTNDDSYSRTAKEWVQESFLEPFSWDISSTTDCNLVWISRRKPPFGRARLNISYCHAKTAQFG